MVVNLRSYRRIPTAPWLVLRPRLSWPRGAWLVLTATALGACSRKPAPAALADAATANAEPGVMTILEGSPLRERLAFDTARTSVRSEAVTVTASVEPDPVRTIRVLPPFTGRVLSVHVRLGDAVAAGDSLVTLSSPDFTSAQADYSHALIAFRQASHELARERDLAQYGIAATRDLEQAETDFSQADGDLRRATAHLTLLGIDTSNALSDQALVVRAPIAGHVTDLSVGVGEIRNDPTVPLMTISDLSSVYLTANVPEKDVGSVQVGERAAAVVSAYPDDTLHGLVSMVGAVVDTLTRMTKARVRMPNPGIRLKPGMYGSITFAAHPHTAVVVPATALLQVGDSTYVFVETRPWTLERRAVLVGSVDGSSAVIRQGLSGGERIVAREVVLLQ
jgi:membrane fusion protein, heavy metal efflux system